MKFILRKYKIVNISIIYQSVKFIIKRFFSGTEPERKNLSYGVFEYLSSRNFIYCELLDGPITKTEIDNVLRSIKKGKSAGKDKLTCEFYIHSIEEFLLIYIIAIY